MKIRVVIIDGMGAGIGVQLVGKLTGKPGLPSLSSLPDAEIEIVALGTNAVATDRMVKAGAQRGATGENAICVSVPQGDFIMGPIGIVIGNSLMGEITPAIASAVLAAPGERILLPLQQEHLFLAGLEQLSLAKMIDRAIDILKERIRLRENA